MPSTYTLISSNVLTSSAASVTFSAIPSTYKDLEVRFSARTDDTSWAAYCWVTVNGASTNFSETYLRGNSATATSGRDSAQSSWYQVRLNGANSDANTFGSASIYFPSYTASQNKPVSIISTNEGNTSTSGYVVMTATAALWSNTSAITSITIDASTGGTNFVSGSSFYLYGIKNS